MRKLFRRIAAISLAALLPLLSGSAYAARTPKKSPEPELQRYSGVIYDAFDTTTTVLAYCETEESFARLMQTAEKELLRYHALFDIYNSCTDQINLRSVNLSAGVQPQKVPEELFSLLSFAKEMYVLTNGEMNVAMGSVLSIWHDVRQYNNSFPQTPLFPDRATLREAAKHCCIDDVCLSEEEQTVYLADAVLRLDVGAIAKGYSVERVVQLLIAEGHDHFSINAGGNVRTVGTKPGGALWNIGITNPDLTSTEPYVEVVSAADKAVVTSGSYQRFFTYEGQRYHHIIDKDSLQPENRYLSVTILADDSALADALSTAVFNMEMEEGKAFIENLEGIEAMWILADGSEEFSSGFGAYLR